MKKQITTIAQYVLGGAVILTLSGCAPWDMIKEKLGMSEKKAEEVALESPTTQLPKEVKGDVALLSIDGKPILEKAEFENFLTQFANSNEFFRSLGAENIPAEIKRKIFDKVVQNKLIAYKAKQMGIPAQDEFKKTYDETVKLVTESLLVQFYEKDFLEKVAVSATEVRSNYDENKEQYIKVAGGVNVKGLKFTDKKIADGFYDSVKKDMSGFDAKAKAHEKGDFQDFGLVSQDPRAAVHSAVPSGVREEAFKGKKVEDVALAVDGDNYWVIQMSDRKESQHFAFDEIKEQLETIVRSAKFKKELEEHLNDLRGEFTLDINNEYFAETQKVVQLPIDQLPIRKIDEVETEEQA